MSPPIMTRAQWNARPPKSRRLFTHSQGVHVHHTTGPATTNIGIPRRIRDIQNFHMDTRDWADIGYSFLFTADGIVVEGRGWDVIGSHTKDWNSKSHGFAYLGDGSTRPPDAALGACRWLLDEHTRRHGPGFLRGHRDAASTTCPGARLYEWVRVGAPGPIPAPPPAAGGVDMSARLVRLPDDDGRVYVAYAGHLEHVPDGEVARELFGDDWAAKVQDIANLHPLARLPRVIHH